ncbi:hypothetical protein AJ78_05581 [Emergomyces pasteurianus Ep9510]|uniref:Uncharacterized protein n=1 Tax=Emergomyces pasteurianus Ep9510 TaxID=1447872 RepID=A0A1J9PDE5_9EURO|nr:hypothetical protein AJ78_05581 [Emergomyces pasteurianus Ep9510]
MSVPKLQPQPQQMSLPPSSTPALESLKQGGSPSHDLAHTSSNSLPLSTYDPQDPAPLLVALPLLEGETTEANPSSPSATVSDGSLEEFPQLPDLLKNIPIDPVIIADDESWETNSIHWPVWQGNNSLVGPKPICSYPEPPLFMFWDAPNYPQVSKERLCIWADNTLTEGNPYIHNSPPLHSSCLITKTDAPCSSGVDEGSRKQSVKWSCIASVSLAGEGSFINLCFHFLSLLLDQQLQFLFWLFESALVSCIPDPNEGAQLAIHEVPREESEETWPGHSEWKKGHGDKWWRWSTEEDARLWGMMEERRS